jgi:hypothetical protein
LHGGRTLVSALREHAHHDLAELRRNLPGRRELRNGLRLGTLEIEVGIIRWMTGQQLVGKRPETVDVIRGARRLPAQLRGARGERRVSCAVRPLRPAAGRRYQAGDAEVGQLHPAAAVEQHVLRFQIPVHDAARVCVLERFGYFEQHRHDVEVCRAAQPSQITAPRELHRQHEDILDPLRRQHLEDPGMLQAVGDVVLALERFPRRRIARGSGRKDLQGDVDAARLVVRAPYFPLSS